MGDRALIVCHKGRTDFAPAIYSHWGGSTVGKMLEAAQGRMRKGDTSYTAARICGVMHENTDGNLGLGLLAAPKSWEEATSAEYSHGDAGVFMLDVDTGLCECFHGYGFDSDADERVMARTFALASDHYR